MSGECSKNGQYKGIIHYKLGVVFYLESLISIHYIIPGMKYFSVYRDCMGPSVLPSPFNFKGCLAEKWLCQNGSSYSQQQDSQEGRNSSTLHFMCPHLVVCHFCTAVRQAAQLQVCSWVSTRSTCYLMAMPRNRRRKPKVNIRLWVDFVGWHVLRTQLKECGNHRGVIRWICTVSFLCLCCASAALGDTSLFFRCSVLS